MMARSFFMIGNDTDVGKTFVTQGLLKAFQQQGVQVQACKPIACGHDNDENNADVQALMHAQNISHADAINMYDFALAAAPSVAAEHEGTVIDMSLLQTWAQEKIKNVEVCLIEGVGGLMVPLTAEVLLRDWLVTMPESEIVLVVGAKLGCVNHTLLTLEALKSIQRKPCCIIINDVANKGMNASTYTMIQNYIVDIPCVCVPYHASVEVFIDIVLGWQKDDG